MASVAVDTSNAAIVARDRRGICVLLPPAPSETITDERALNLAAWLVAMAADGPERFADVLRAVLRT